MPSLFSFFLMAAMTSSLLRMSVFMPRSLLISLHRFLVGGTGPGRRCSWCKESAIAFARWQGPTLLPWRSFNLENRIIFWFEELWAFPFFFFILAWLKLSFCLYERPFWFLRLAAQQWPNRFVHAPDFSSKSYSKSGSRNVRSALLKWHLSKTLLFCILNDLKENANVTTSGFLHVLSNHSVKRC